jgi:hypothetical protein
MPAVIAGAKYSGMLYNQYGGRFTCESFTNNAP